MTTVVVLGAATAFVIAAGGAVWFGRLTAQIAREKVIVFRGHVYEVVRVDEAGDPTLRRIH